MAPPVPSPPPPPPLTAPLALSGMLGLAALSVTHWLRDRGGVPGAIGGFVLGVMPNLAAGYAMPLVLSAMVRGIAAAPTAVASSRGFARMLAFTTIGLVAWEFLQLSPGRLRFDPFDIVATAVGAWGALRTHRRLLARASEPLTTPVGPPDA